jgi:hypothetical protein
MKKLYMTENNKAKRFFARSGRLKKDAAKQRMTSQSTVAIGEER